MFDFREIKLSDRDWINERLAISDFQGCEYSFANNLAWRRLNDTLISSYEDFYISCSFENGDPFFTFPAGLPFSEDSKEKYIELFEKLRNYVGKQNKPLVITSVNSEHLKWMMDYYGDKIEVVNNRDNYDYIYNSSDLIDLKGKKYHGKRNHIRRFKDNDWSFEPIKSEDVNQCITFAANFYNNNDSYDDFSAVVEQYAIHTFFNHFNELNLKGGILKSKGEIVGFTLGEQLNSNTFVVHIEKALTNVQGAYPTIANEFLKQYANEFKFINREEDLGVEGLRKSKLSYYPVYLLEKTIVIFK